VGEWPMPSCSNITSCPSVVHYTTSERKQDVLERRLASRMVMHDDGWSFSSRGLGVMQAPVCWMLFRARGRTVAFGFAAVRTALGARETDTHVQMRVIPADDRTRQGLGLSLGSLHRQQ